MSEPPFDRAKAHRWFAVELNNLSWDLVEMTRRTADQQQLMIHASHAACYHWLQAGDAVNHQRALHLLASAYTRARRPMPAIEHAVQCFELSAANGERQSPFDRACALECLARAHACAGHGDEARMYRKMAIEAGRRISDQGERKAFETQLFGGEWFGVDDRAAMTSPDS